jgi:hypothetical protein
MSKLLWACFIVVTWMVVPTQNSFGQDFGAVRVFREQVVQLHTKTKLMLTRSEEQTRAPQTTDNQRAIVNALEEINALTKLVNSLGEDASRSYVDGLRKASETAKSGGTPLDPDKTLLVVESECNEMSFVLSTLYNFLQTGDRSFLGFARKGDELTSSIEAVL